VTILTKVTIEIDKCEYCNHYENPNKEKQYEYANLEKCEVCGKDICKEHKEKITFEVSLYVNNNIKYPDNKLIELNVCKSVHRADKKFMELAVKKMINTKKSSYGHSKW
jgi:hypothetical protein